MDNNNSKVVDQEIKEIYTRFFDGVPVAAEMIETSRGDADFRITAIITPAEGEKHVLKIVSNDFTFPAKIRMWQRTIEEYRNLGYYCPRIITDKQGGFPTVRYRDRDCVVYSEEFSKYKSLEDRTSCMENGLDEEYDRYLKDIWSMTAKIAAKKFDYTDYPSAYCLFETFCPSDLTDEVLENALEWKSIAERLPVQFSEQVQRIWRLWSDNRENLKEMYAKLPTSVFQADLNSTNLLIDEEGNFKGVFDFNLSGREVFLNYLMRENSSETIPEALQISCAYYTFSEEEKEAALPLYRCLKPLWWSSIRELKDARDDEEKVRRCLDAAESCLTEEIDWKRYMEPVLSV